jgi:thioester reductase-like protein
VATTRVNGQAIVWRGIFRPGRISGRSTDGVCKDNDITASILIGMKKMGSFPDMPFPYDIAPVDFCAKAMIEVMQNICKLDCGTYKKVHHIFNKETIRFCDLFKGMGLKGLSLADWRIELQQIDRNNKELLPLTPFFLSPY